MCDDLRYDDTYFIYTTISSVYLASSLNGRECSPLYYPSFLQYRPARAYWTISWYWSCTILITAHIFLVRSLQPDSLVCQCRCADNSHTLVGCLDKIASSRRGSKTMSSAEKSLLKDLHSWLLSAMKEGGKSNVFSSVKVILLLERFTSVISLRSYII